jgi:hypothetical protein
MILTKLIVKNNKYIYLLNIELPSELHRSVIICPRQAGPSRCKPFQEAPGTLTRPRFWRPAEYGFSTSSPQNQLPQTVILEQVETGRFRLKDTKSDFRPWSIFLFMGLMAHDLKSRQWGLETSHNYTRPGAPGLIPLRIRDIHPDFKSPDPR